MAGGALRGRSAQEGEGSRCLAAARRAAASPHTRGQQGPRRATGSSGAEAPSQVPTTALAHEAGRRDGKNATADSVPSRPRQELKHRVQGDERADPTRVTKLQKHVLVWVRL